MRPREAHSSPGGGDGEGGEPQRLRVCAGAQTDRGQGGRSAQGVRAPGLGHVCRGGWRLRGLEPEQGEGFHAGGCAVVMEGWLRTPRTPK